MSNPAGSTHRASEKEFSWSNQPEPHATRRREILAKHPEIETLFVTEPLTFVVVTIILAIQLTMVYLLQDANWFVTLVCAYTIGGTLNHSLQLAAHELSHNLCWSSVFLNKCTALYANFATGFPSSITFQRYHMDHHAMQGVDLMDTDVPTEFEVSHFTNTAAKFLWLICQPLWYAFRPLFMKPKPFILWEGVNWVTQLTFDAVIIYFFGFKGMGYLWIGTLLGLGLHPSAGHFIAEHYEFTKGQETYSYYGFWNLINFNVGYHNEHHDFPRVPWTKLALVKAYAPEYYNLPHYDSYIAVMYRYLFDPTIGPWSRIKRHASASVQAREDKKKSESKLADNIFKYVAAGMMAAAIVVAIFFIAS